MTATLRAVLTALVLSAAWPVGGGKAVGATVWLAGVDPFVRARMAGAGPDDFDALFDPAAPWRRAARSVSVFKVSTQYLLYGSEDELRRMIVGLKQRGIALGFEALMIPRHGACGQVEGYSDPGAIATAAWRVRRLGGTLDYAAMDEPLWFGHFDQSAAACRSSVAEVASQLAENVRALRAVFPDIRIGDIEPFQGSARDALEPADVLAFSDAYRHATGIPLAFVDADLDWRHHAERDLKALKTGLHASGIQFGVIYDGDPDDPTDIAWTRDAELRAERIEQQPAEVPDVAVLQTWMVRPTRFLPETQSGAMTSLVLRYARAPTRLALLRDRGAVVGRLTAAAGAPVAGAVVGLWACAGAAARPLSARRRMDGVAPSGAEKALVAVRVNTETDAVGAGRLVIGLARYRDAGGAAIESDPLDGLGGEDGAEHDLPVARGQRVARNGLPFRVTPGRPFTLEVPFGATAGLEDAGYVALIFLGADGRETKRLEIPMTPARAPLGEARTDAGGRFRIAAAPAPARDLIIGADYPGDDRLRGATAAIP